MGTGLFNGSVVLPHRSVHPAKARLRRYLPCKGGTPSHGTFGRLVRPIKPDQFEAVPADLARRVAAAAAGAVAIDGKAVQGRADVRHGVPALHLLHASTTDAAWLSHHGWPGLAAIGRVDRTRVCKQTGAATTEHQLCLPGHAYTPERLLAPPRGQWAVDNRHWVLDVALGEDASLVRRGHGPRNHAALKRGALNAVRTVTGRNSIRHTMRNAVLSVQVPADILNHMPAA